MNKYQYQDHLESERLVTRFLMKEHTKLWADYFNDKETMEFFPLIEKNSNNENARLWIKRQQKRYIENQFGLQAIIEKKTNSFVGQCGLLTQEVDGIKEIEVGYHVLKQFRQQGYAPEAAKLFIDYAFQNHITNSIISIIDKTNFKSQRVAEKNGLIKEKETIWKDMKVYIYRINK
jgi:[ribosomal protein S5]-alanine N-acetyltransferase